MSFLIALVFVPPALALCALALVFAAEVFAAFAQDPARPADEGERGDAAIVIPAHNEGAGVVATIENVRTQMTANDRLIVVADNCSDDTAEQARAAGAEVIERTDPARRGKGYALQFGVDHLRADAPSVVVFLDADCRMAANALDRIVRRARVMNRPVQALYLMAPPEGADAKAAISAFAWLLINDVRMSGMQKLAGFSRLTGAGMAFPWPLIAQADLASGEIVEDLALTIKMIDAGARALSRQVGGGDERACLKRQGRGDPARQMGAWLA
ncbi:MAG: glycosyltransferase family 2 protein [Parvularculaceae bacterium]